MGVFLWARYPCNERTRHLPPLVQICQTRTIDPLNFRVRRQRRMSSGRQKASARSRAMHAQRDPRIYLDTAGTRKGSRERELALPHPRRQTILKVTLTILRSLRYRSVNFRVSSARKHRIASPKYRGTSLIRNTHPNRISRHGLRKGSRGGVFSGK